MEYKRPNCPKCGKPLRKYSPIANNAPLDSFYIFCDSDCIESIIGFGKEEFRRAMEKLGAEEIMKGSILRVKKEEKNV